MKTYVPKQGETTSEWWLVDATDLTLGRLATVVASRLRGKHKPTFTPYLDTGDHVVVVNAEKIVLTGKKPLEKMYRRYSGYPGGLREERAVDLLRTRPERIIEEAVWGMLPKGPLGRRIVRHLKVYRGQAHPHASQNPQPLAIPDAARAR